MDYDVTIVGAGPVGLAAAIDLGRRGVNVLLVERRSAPCNGSRAIVIDNAALRHFHELGCSDLMIEKGLVAEGRRTFLGATELFRANFPTRPINGLPLFLNLPQCETEQILNRKVSKMANITVRRENTVTGVRQNPDSVTVTLRNACGEEEITSQYLLACDGCHSPVRKMMGITFPGYTCPSQFLIVDVQAKLDGRKEHSFYFDHPTNPGLTLLIVPQPNDVWRIDWQLPTNVSIDHIRQPHELQKRIRGLIGDIKFDIVGHSVYQFHQKLASRMSYGRVFLAGDAAHLVNPFGARGMNSGIQDARNICWKLEHVLKGVADPAILENYHNERSQENEEHQRLTRKAMNFIAPKTMLGKMIRDQILGLSRTFKPLRQFVRSGKMSDFPLADAPLA
jgi:3-(3-hydroxy-phenyl)propionate hydroxylase